MPPRKPIELFNAEMNRDAAWKRYDQTIESNAPAAEKEAAYDAAKQAEREVRFWYSLWQKVGGTSNIESIIEAFEREQDFYHRVIISGGEVLEL